MRENTHPLDQEEVMAYLDGQLPVEDATRAAEHLRECRECQELAADLQGVSRHMATWQIEAADTGMTPTLISALQQHEEAAARNSKHGASRWEVWLGGFRIPRLVLAVAGAALALLVIAGTLTTQRNLAVSRQSATMAESQVSEASHVASGSSSHAVRRIEGEDRDQLRAMQAQVASSMEYAPRPTAPASASAPAADNNTGSTFYAAASRTMIVRTAQLTIVVKDFDSSQKKLQEILKRHGGYVGEMTTSAPEGADRRLSATLRVPTSQLDSAIAEVKELGHVESESQSGEEVTSQYVDLQARLSNARNTEQRLIELLRRQTGKLDEVVTVEEKISEVREEIERMEAERKSLSERVDFGTLSVSFNEPRKTQLQVVPPSVGTQFHNAAVEGYRSVVDGIVSLLVFLMSWGPSLLLWAAILFFPVRFAWRKLRREAV
jgi:anti-sigma factor RsiW